MFIPYNHESVRLTGRWASIEAIPEAAVTTAPGSYIEIAFKGNRLTLSFDILFNEHPFPHLWIVPDNGAHLEAPLDKYIQIQMPDNGMKDTSHVVRIIFKSANEMQHRWYFPLVGKVAFLGYEADAPAKLSPDPRPVMEFVGDSITEGVLIDESLQHYSIETMNRVYQDDSTATYAFLTSQMLNLRPIVTGYSATGITKSGCGAVPNAITTYPRCFHNAPISHRSDYIVINHGTNDSLASESAFIEGYKELLDCLHELQPSAKIILLGPFCGVFADTLNRLSEEYNEAHHTDTFFVDTRGWIPSDPLHPTRIGHQTVADRLVPILRERYCL